MTYIIWTVNIISYLNALLIAIMFSIVMQSVVMPSIIIMSIVEPIQNISLVPSFRQEK
jgi:hypothetical protein